MMLTQRRGAGLRFVAPAALAREPITSPKWAVLSSERGAKRRVEGLPATFPIPSIKQSEAIGSSVVPRQGKSGLFWESRLARMKKMKTNQKRRLFECIVLAAQGAKMESLD